MKNPESVSRSAAEPPYDVIVVGAGPAGLATAIELGHRGVRCLLIERTETPSYAPRAKMTNVRTRTHLRRWGIAATLAEASPLGVDYPSNIAFVTRLGGPGIALFERALFCEPKQDQRYPEHSQWIPQYKLEAVLLDHARSLASVSIAFGMDFLTFTEDADGIVVRVRDIATGNDRALSTRFLIGADGARSLVRAQMGARMVGQYGLSKNYNIIFEAPGLAEAHRHGPAIQYWQMNADLPSLLGPMDVGDLWFFMPTGIADGAAYSEAEALGLIRLSTGIDLPYRVVSSDEWTASRLLADRYRAGGAFLAGDACHLHPPFGGYGMNMGIADGVDLGWKIAGVLQGWGGDELLDSYEHERRPAHNYVMDEAVANHALSPNQLYRDGIEDDSPRGEAVRAEIGELIKRAKVAEYYGLGVVLGYCYRESSIILDDGTGDEWKPSRDYVPSATPGCIVPHRWLDDGTSLYDRFGSVLTLLVLGEQADEAAIAVREAEHTHVPLTVVTLADPELREVYGASLVLVRPDQVVAWRGDHWASGTIEVVTGRVAHEADAAA